MSREKTKNFWLNRAKVHNVPRPESQVNFKSDPKTADLYVQSEIAVINDLLTLSSKDILVDLGAGNGRFSLLFAPKVHKVITVEYIEDFAQAIVQQAKNLGYANIEVINAPAENFCREDFADIVFVSGLLHYLDQEQYGLTIKNISKTLKPGAILFMRETISVLENEFIVDKFSEELGAHYYSIYRTCRQHIAAFNEQKINLLKQGHFFEDGSVLNNRLETRLDYFIFQKGLSGA